MSSKYRKSSRRERSSHYPSIWSEWEWNDHYQCRSRYRQIRHDEWEWEYGDGPGQAAETPRTVPSPDPISVPSHGSDETQYTSLASYTTTSSSSLDDVVQRLSGATLEHPVTQGGSTYTTSQYFTQIGATGSLNPSQSPSTRSGPSCASPQSITQGRRNFSSITTRDPNTTSEIFDSRYRVHRSWNFELGCVFKVLWTEPTDAEDSAGEIILEGNRKGACEDVRRFVVIEPREGHCICLPIMTYFGEGVNKAGVDAEVHTIISTSKHPHAYTGEYKRGLIKTPIRVTPIDSSHKLDVGSRLKYVNPFAVEYNVKVWFIGRVHSNSEEQLLKDYEVFAVNRDQVEGGGPSTHGSYPEASTYTDYGLSTYSGYSSSYRANPYSDGTSNLNPTIYEECRDPGDDLIDSGDSDNDRDQRDQDGAGGREESGVLAIPF